jgi:hypothetical protein
MSATLNGDSGLNEPIAASIPDLQAWPDDREYAVIAHDLINQFAERRLSIRQSWFVLMFAIALLARNQETPRRILKRAGPSFWRMTLDMYDVINSFFVRDRDDWPPR